MKKNGLYRFSSRSYLIAILCFLFLLDVFALWYVLKIDYDRTLDHARIVLQKTSISMEERVKRTVVATEAILHNRAQRIQETGFEKTISSIKEWERFQSAARSLPDAGTLWLLDDKGNLLMDSTEYPSQRINFSEREYFAPQRDKGIELYIGPVVKGKITRKYSFTISHRINGKDGRFLGIVLAAINTDDFTNFLDNIDIGPGSTITVFRTDGALVLRQPMQDEYLGKTFTHLKLFSMPFHESPAGIFETNAIDGINRLVAYRKIPEFPLLVVTGIPVDSVLQGWWTHVKYYSLTASFIFLALIGLSLLVRKTTSREEKERTQELSNINKALEAEIVAHQQAEIALRESEQRWATTLASIGDGVIATDVTGNITFMNAVAETLTGWTLEEAAARPIAEVFCIINEVTRSPVDNPVTKVLQKGIIVSLANHTILVQKDGAEIPIDDSGAPIRDAGNNIVGVVLIFRDITKRKEAEEALRASEERFKAIASNTPDHLLIQDRELRYVFVVNPQLGMTEQDVIGKTDYDILSREDAERLTKIKKQVLETGEPVYFETPISRDGEEQFFDGSYVPKLNASGQVDGLIGYFKNVTERKKREVELFRLNRVLKALSDSDQAMIHAESESRFLKDICRIILEDCGYSMVWIGFAEEDEERTVRPVAYAGFEEGYLDALKLTWADTERGRGPTGTAIRMGKPSLCTDMLTDPSFELWRGDALKLGYASSIALPLIASGKTMGALTIYSKETNPFLANELDLLTKLADDLANGITALRLREEHRQSSEALRRAHDELESRVQERTFQLSEAYETLQREVEERKKTEEQLIRVQKLEALGTLAGGIAHDFNNILAGIIGFTEMVYEDTPPDSPEYRKLGLVLKGAHRGRDLVKQILAFSRQNEQDKKPLAMNHVVEEGLKLLRPTIPSTIEIVSESITDDDIILADPAQMHQVLMNLAMNASHAMREKGGILAITVSKTVFAKDVSTPVPAMKPGEYITLEVRDTGCGIDPKTLERIFDPFFTTKEQGEGTGLGLSVVHGIIKSHGGYIAVKSEPENGTAFHVYLPKIEELATTGKAEIQATTGNNERILIVDDEDILVELNSQRLNKLGYEVVATTSSIDALDIFRKGPDTFDLVITDYTMPNLTGIDLAAELLKIKATIPIILCTGHSETVSPEMAKKAGIKAFLMKPLTKEELARTIRQVLDGTFR